MDEKTQPVFDDILRLDDAWLQNHLARAADSLIVAALDGAPPAVRLKVLANLSTRRRSALEQNKEETSDRSRMAARRSLVQLLWELPEAEETGGAAPAGFDGAAAMRQLAGANPVLAQAQRRRREAIEVGILRRLAGWGP